MLQPCVGVFVDGHKCARIARGHDVAVAGAMAWLDAHYAEPFNAALLAARVHLSVSALYARFKAHRRVTPQQYQKELRRAAATRRRSAAPELINRGPVRGRDIFGAVSMLSERLDVDL